MTKKNIFTLVIIFILTVVGGYFYSFVKKDAPLYNDNYARGEMNYRVGFDANNPFSYSFKVEQDKLTAVKMLFTVKGNAGKNKINYNIMDEQGKIVAENSLRISKFKNGKFTMLDFDTIEASRGKTYTLNIMPQKDCDCEIFVGEEPDGARNPAISYTYIKWDLQTMIVFVILVSYLVAFIVVLRKLFRK